jgi:predicted  nucleic acid-binding Zn-ribbon protein
LNEELRILSEVQKLDTKILENERKRAQAPVKMETMEKELAQTRDTVAREKEVIEELDKERKRKEKELESEKENIKKSESKLHEVKTNKQYQASLKEIEAAQAANDKTEEEIILLMERAEELKKDHGKASAYLAKREKEAGAELKAVEQEMRSVDDVISQLKKEKAGLLAHVGSKVQSRYQILLDKRGGVAVVNVKNGVCLGCFMNIPPQLFIEAMKNHQFIACPSCNRLFYYLEDEQE